MDGRDLSNEIIAKWDSEMSLYNVALLIPNFIKKVLTNTNYNFYGKFIVGAVYDLKNFNNMLVNSFHCRLERAFDPNPGNFQSPEGGYTLILTDDCLILFENFENNPTIGKIIFWSTLYAITDVQINKNTRNVKINFYSDDRLTDKELRLVFANVLFFRDALVKRMNNLKIKVESMKYNKGENQEKRYSAKELLSYYIINTYSILCGKAIEYYSANDENKNNNYLNEMKTVLMMPGVQKIMNEDTNFPK